MFLRDVMLKDLERGLAIVRDGHEMRPAWRIFTPDEDFLILTRFDPDEPDHRARAMALIPRFMAWKLATAFILTTETWLGPERTRSGEEAVAAIGISYHERLGVVRRIRRTPSVVFEPPEWLGPDQIDGGYLRMLPSGRTTLTAEEVGMLTAIFAEDGELPRTLPMGHARAARVPSKSRRPLSSQ
jgi:hypothetical protein